MTDDTDILSYPLTLIRVSSFSSKFIITETLYISSDPLVTLGEYYSSEHQTYKEPS